MLHIFANLRKMSSKCKALFFNKSYFKADFQLFLYLLFNSFAHYFLLYRDKIFEVTAGTEAWHFQRVFKCLEIWKCSLFGVQRCMTRKIASFQNHWVKGNKLEMDNIIIVEKNMKCLGSKTVHEKSSHWRGLQGSLSNIYEASIGHERKLG